MSTSLRCAGSAPTFAPTLAPALRWAVLVLSLAVGGCASAPPGSPPARAALFDDVHVAPPRAPVDPDDVFRITPPMRGYLDRELIPQAGRLGNRLALTSALYSRNHLQLEYDASMTRNAGQAFEARSGNCLSLLIMTGAFAKALGLDVTFQEVDTEADESWSRVGDLYFMSGHVNVIIGRRAGDGLRDTLLSSPFVIDFQPQGTASPAIGRPLDEKTVLAMYMNNRAAEAMLQGALDDAYWRARKAIEIDPAFLGAYNTLGVIYLRRADAAHADAAFRYAIERAPDDARLLSNEVQALRELGRDDEARAMQARLDRVEAWPPFYFFNRGQAAYKAGNLREAREWFLKELARSPAYHEFHFWLAITDYGLGDADGARREMALAADGAVRRTDHDLYAAKLDRLNALSPPRRTQ